jgi:hypothetical protein
VPRAWYVAEAGDLLVSHDDVRLQQDDVLGDATVPLHELVQLHGLHADGFASAPHRWQPIRAEGDPAEISRTLRELPVHGATGERQLLEDALVEAAGLAVARVAVRTTPPPRCTGR